MAAQQGLRSTDLRVLEDALGIGLTASGDTVDSLSAEGAYYLERILRPAAECLDPEFGDFSSFPFPIGRP